ncbi:MAG: hypothetical protein ACRDRL_34155 [Sciscionella sp.]
MSGRAADPDGPEDVDAEFAAIIAELEREGLGSNLSAIESAEPECPHESGWAHTDGAATEHGAEAGGQGSDGIEAWPASWRSAEQGWGWESASDTEHYIPPEPPPLPRLRAGTILAIVVLAAGMVVLIAPALMGLTPRLALPIGVLAVVSGLGLLLLRMRVHNDDDGDNGAQV